MTVSLRRTVRFALNNASRGVNGFAGSPGLTTLEPFMQATVECRGEPDPASGYLINIKAIDDAVHETVRPALVALHARGRPEFATLTPTLAGTLDSLKRALPVEVRSVRLDLSPYHALEMHTDAKATCAVLLRFDFAAAHRLHVPDWDEHANREFFGKCNNPNGHGHNYGVEVRVLVPTDGAFSTNNLERLVDDTVIERFDHKHLNLDTPEFADDGGLNPTVENIARVCHDLLKDPVAALGPGISLASVTVWETDRTSAQYPA